MIKKDIIKSLSHLQRLRIGGEPDPSWVRSARAQLLARVTEQAPAVAPRRSVADVLAAVRDALAFDASLAARPVLAGFVAFGLVLGSGVGAVSASLGTVPGDALYQVKIVSERARIAVAPSETDKTTLRMAYVGRRVEEVSKLAERQAPDSARRVTATVQRIKQDLSTVQQNLTDLPKTAAAMDVAKVAKLVDEKSEEYSAKLEKTNDQQLSVPAQTAVKEAKALVEDISVQAVAVLVQAHANGAVSGEDIVKTVGEKIASIAGKAAKVAGQEASSSTPSLPGIESASQAIAALGEAQGLLSQQDYVSALTKVIEGKELVQAAQQIIDATSGATALTTLSNASSTPAGPAVLGGTTIGIGPVETGTSTSSCGTACALPEPQETPTASDPDSGVTTSTSPSSDG